MTSRRKCRRCGAQLAVGKPFCSRCGTYQPLFPDRGLSGVTTRGNNPGWFKDPFGRAAYRYWDGQIWSERVYTAEYGTDVFSIDTLKDEQVPDGVWRATFGSLAVSLGGLIVAFVLSFLFLLPLLLLGHPGGSIAELVASEAGLWAGLFGTCWLTSRRYGTGSIKGDYRLRFRWIDLLIALGAAVVARCFSILVLIPFVHALRATGNPDSSLDSVTSLGWAGWLTLALISCVGAPFFEEMFFRGLLQGQLVERFGPAVAIALTSIVFGSAHIANDPGIGGLLLGLSVGASGVVLGTVRHLTHRLGSSMLTHALFNTMALIALAFVATL
ncbi:MAG TPA: CPBP family glutamic-type intramembrane protease [Acidimicrobiales bacterium]